MKLPKMFQRKRGRKYPIKRDGEGRTARQRCFEMLKDKVPLPEIAKTVGVKIETVRKYYQQWKKNPDIERNLAYYNWIFDPSAPDRERSKEITASLFGMSKEQLETVLQQPYGLRRLLSNKIYSPAHADAAHKRHIAMELALLISDHLVKHDGKFEDVYFAIKHWMQQNRLYREDEDENIKEENEQIAFLRRIMEADLEFEQQGRVQPERLSAKEQDTMRKWGKQSEVEKIEMLYWFRIGELMVGGITMDQAREKLYQDFINSGDVEAATALRQYQDIVHPLKTNNQQPPPSKS